MRADFSSYQGEGPQACWRQVKGLQRRYGGKVAAGLYRFRLRLECVSKCLKRIFGPSGCISVLKNLDLQPVSLRFFALKCNLMASKLHLPAFKEIPHNWVVAWRGEF